MYPLLKRINIDLVKLIHQYNNYSKVDMEWFKYLHKERYRDVLIVIELKRLYYKLDLLG